MGGRWAAASHGLRTCLTGPSALRADGNMACRPSPVCSCAAGRANACRSVTELLAVPEVAALLAEGAAAAGCQQSSSSSSSDSSSSSSGGSSAGAAGQRRKLVLVFGREVEGLLDHEVDACDYTLSIPIGRLQGGRSSCRNMPCVRPHQGVVVGPAAYTRPGQVDCAL